MFKFWEKIKPFLIGVGVALSAVLGFFIAGRVGKTARSRQSDIDKNNNRIRQGFNESGKRLDECSRIVSEGKSDIEDTRGNISRIIDDATKSEN